MTRHTKQVRWIAVHTYHINVCIMFVVMAVGYYPFIQTILGYDKGTPIPKPLEPACQNKCVISVPHSSVDGFDSLSLNSTEALFVHFSGLSLNPSNDTDILDPLNLV